MTNYAEMECINMNKNIKILQSLYKNKIDGTITKKNLKLYKDTFEFEWNRIHDERNILLQF
jgi:hypothetical protein